MEKEDGVWRTIQGRKVFIRSGESLGSAMSRSGKFKREDIREGKKQASFDDRADKVLKAKPFSREQVKEQQKHTGKYGVRTINSYNQAEKNRINENAPINKDAKTRVERNKERYSETDRRELRHEELQKKLADYKAKKQSNNKLNNEYTRQELKDKYGTDDVELINAGKEKENRVKLIDEKQSNNKFSQKEQLKKEIAHEVVKAEQNGNKAHAEAGKRELERLNKQSNNKVDPYDDPESNESQRLQSIQSRYDEYLQDTEGRGASYGEIAHIEGLRGKKLDDFEKELDDYETKKYNKQETIKNYVEKKKSNNNVNTNAVIERSGKVNQKTLKSYASDGTATDITRYSDKDIDKLEKKHGRLTHLKTSMGTYGMNGALLKSEKTGEYFVITARNSTLFRLV